MYSGDHILLSSIYGLIAARRLRLPIMPTLFVSILANMIDLDHLTYSITDNVYLLHHFYVGALLFMIVLYALWKPQYLAVSFVAVGGIALHLSADVLATLINYNLHAFLGMDVIWGLSFLIVSEKIIVAGPKRLFQVSILGLFLFCWLEQGSLLLIFNLDPQHHWTLTYLNAGLLPLVGALSLVAFFSDRFFGRLSY